MIVSSVDPAGAWCPPGRFRLRLGLCFDITEAYSRAPNQAVTIKLGGPNLRTCESSYTVGE